MTANGKQPVSGEGAPQMPPREAELEQAPDDQSPLTSAGLKQTQETQTEDPIGYKRPQVRVAVGALIVAVLALVCSLLSALAAWRSARNSELSAAVAKETLELNKQTASTEAKVTLGTYEGQIFVKPKGQLLEIQSIDVAYTLDSDLDSPGFLIFDRVKAFADGTTIPCTLDRGRSNSIALRAYRQLADGETKFKQLVGSTAWVPAIFPGGSEDFSGLADKELYFDSSGKTLAMPASAKPLGREVFRKGLIPAYAYVNGELIVRLDHHLRFFSITISFKDGTSYKQNIADLRPEEFPNVMVETEDIEPEMVPSTAHDRPKR